MALVTCPDCGAEISDKAAACIKCGAPVAVAPTNGVVTTQQTGKTYKGLQFVGVVFLALGVGACASGSKDATVPLTMIGALLYAIGRIGAWWKHG